MANSAFFEYLKSIVNTEVCYWSPRSTSLALAVCGLTFKTQFFAVSVVFVFAKNTKKKTQNVYIGQIALSWWGRFTNNTLVMFLVITTMLYCQPAIHPASQLVSQLVSEAIPFLVVIVIVFCFVVSLLKLLPPFCFCFVFFFCYFFAINSFVVILFFYFFFLDFVIFLICIFFLSFVFVMI